MVLNGQCVIRPARSGRSARAAAAVAALSMYPVSRSAVWSFHEMEVVDDPHPSNQVSPERSSGHVQASSIAAANRMMISGGSAHARNNCQTDPLTD